MRFTDVAGLTDTPSNQLVPLTTELWAHAVLLGAARQRQGGGSQRADRGRHNAHVDHMGAFGELLLLKLITPFDADGAALAHFQSHIYLSEGAAADSTPDLVFKDAENGVTVGIDAKTFDCDRAKRYFAINDGKHRALSGKCDYYFCALARPFGRRAAIGRLVPYADVDPARETFPENRWFVGNLLSRGSPSRNLYLDRFLRDYFTTPPEIGELRRQAYSRREIMMEIDKGRCTEALKALIPALDTVEAQRRAKAWALELDEKEAAQKAKEAARRKAKRSD